MVAIVGAHDLDVVQAQPVIIRIGLNNRPGIIFPVVMVIAAPDYRRE
jgi:hypothetical protein